MNELAVEDFKDAWLDAQGDSFAHKMARQSLQSLADDVPVLGIALDELLAPEQEQLEVHIDEGSVREHTAPASALADFLHHMSEAVKEITKGLTGRKRLVESLLVTAPAPGSVMLKFKTPESRTAQKTIAGTDVSTPDAQALRYLTQLMASSETNEESLYAATLSLDRKARIAMRHLAETVSEQNWVLQGELRARNRQNVRLTLSQFGAHRLIDAVNERSVETTTVVILGSMDGWSWSTGSLRFHPIGDRAFSAHVPGHLQAHVADLVAKHVEDVRLTFSRTVEVPSGLEAPMRTTYTVTAIDDQEKSEIGG